MGTSGATAEATSAGADRRVGTAVPSAVASARPEQLRGALADRPVQDDPAERARQTLRHRADRIDAMYQDAAGSATRELTLVFRGRAKQSPALRTRTPAHIRQLRKRASSRVILADELTFARLVLHAALILGRLAAPQRGCYRAAQTGQVHHIEGTPRKRQKASVAIDVLITTTRIAHDPVGRELIDHLQQHASSLQLDGAALYYDFPIYSDYETVAHKPDALILSPRHGVVALRFVKSDGIPERGETTTLQEIDQSLGQFCSILIGRLLKSRTLRADRSTLLFAVTPVIIFSEWHGSNFNAVSESEPVTSLAGLDSLLEKLPDANLDGAVLGEVRSVVEGAKALSRPQKRIIEDPHTQRAAAALSKLEAEIANFDQQQRRAALVHLPGPQRIRGLAGSGKTVILAMKAAHLHVSNPDAQILLTFYTRSLRSSIRNMVTRFYRHYKDEDPDWGKIHIVHSWGGKTDNGVYADTCRRHGHVPLSYSDATRLAATTRNAFDFACRDLLEKVNVEPYYDHILIDEGQDFPTGFYELCFALARGSRDSKNIVWAYDELQTIMNIQIRSAEELFGTDVDGHPKISLDRAAQLLPATATNDTVLSKCYRNQREVLVTAHALGFGIYGGVVQLLESEEHWQDVGYEVLSGDFSVGSQIKILRPEENSPLGIDPDDAGKLIICHVAKSVDAELEWIVKGVCDFLASGLQPEDIILIALDDRNARKYFVELSRALAMKGVETNNILADPYSEPPFTIPGKVTMSTVYRAKGNEGAVVFALGVDAIPLKTRSGRNRVFTAFTRTKAWLRVSGLEPTAESVIGEVTQAVAHFPFLEFTMPDLQQVELIQRDLGRRAARAKRIRAEFTTRLREEGFSDDEITGILAGETLGG